MSNQYSSLFDNNNDSSDSDSSGNSDSLATSNPITTTTINDGEDKQARIDALLESIGSIPPVVCILISNLSYRDHLSCLYVCKLWSSIAQGYLWRHVSFHSTSSERDIPTPLTPAKIVIIRKRVHRIRSLALPLANTSLLDMPCTQLRSLEVWANERVHVRRRFHALLAQGAFVNFANLANHLQTPQQDQLLVPSALSLIPKNPYLSHIHLEQFENLFRSLTPDIMTSFSQLPLRSLHLGITCSFYDSPAIAAILPRCPSTLQSLEISIEQVGRFFSGANNHASMDADAAAQVQWSPMPALRALKITHHLPVPDPSMILFPLLRQCPHLEELWIPRMRSDDSATKFFNILLHYCLSIKVLRLFSPSPPFNDNLQMPIGYPSQELLRVVNMYQGLREIETIVRLQEMYPIIPTLILHSGWSLEVIVLGVYCTEALIVRNPYISSILQACGRLKSLSVLNRGSGRSCISLRDLVETNWASNRLESLSILVREAGYGVNGQWIEIFPNETQQREQEDTAMLLFQLSMKYRAQKQYTGPPPTWWEMEANMLSYESAVKYTDGAMNTEAWKRIRLETAPLV